MLDFRLTLAALADWWDSIRCAANVHHWAPVNRTTRVCVRCRCRQRKCLDDVWREL